nr:probable LRR receptor-like serine/threonine-protein kinase At1g53430 [Ipomoea batatas]
MEKVILLLLFLLLLFALNSQITMGEGKVSTTGPISEICTVNNLGDNEVKKLGTDDENAITELLGCETRTYSSTNSVNCKIQSSDKVTCDCSLDKDVCRVTEIDFTDRNLDGKLPEIIGNLTNLTSLKLYWNKFSGEIPTSYANLKNLKHLDLEGNKLEGSIPLFLGDMKLDFLDLSDNSFDGQIPPQLASLKNLTLLDLSSNSFGGPIPTQLASLKSLTYLYLSENLFSGSFPTHLSSLVNLQYLYLSHNSFDGPIPPQLNSFVNLMSLELSNNDFSGPLPDKLENLRLLEYLNVQGNNLSGRIPDFTGQLQNLTQLVLLGNNFEGPLTAATFSNLKNLEELVVSDLVGGGESQFPNFTNMHSLQYLTLRNCSLAGPIPDIIWNLRGLYFLDLSFNGLFGQIPNHPTQIPLYIFLRGNKLNGTIPKWIINSTMKIDVSENLFTNNVAQIQNLHSSSSNLNFFSSLNSSDDGGTHWEHVGYSCSSKLKYQLNDSLYINCGGESMQINGSNYEGDLNSNGSSTFFLSSSSRWGYSSMGSNLFINDEYIMNNTCTVGVGDEALYSTARVSPISLKYYGFCLKDGEYTVKLHFAELVKRNNYKTPYLNKSGRVFNVDIQGINVLNDFNIEKEAGGVGKAYIKKTENVTVKNNSRLEIHLYWLGKGSAMYQGPLISAISVHPCKSYLFILSLPSAPFRLYPTFLIKLIFRDVIPSR